MIFVIWFKSQVSQKTREIIKWFCVLFSLEAKYFFSLTWLAVVFLSLTVVKSEDLLTHVESCSQMNVFIVWTNGILNI